MPLSATSSFTAYAARDFGASDQERLAAVLRALGTRKVAALLSNSDCGTTRELHRGFDRIDSVSAPPHQLRRSRSRSRDELLVRSFDYPVATVATVAGVTS